MNDNSYVKLFIDVRYAYNAGSIKMFHLVNSSMSFTSESYRDLLKYFTNPFAWDQYGIDQ